MLIVFISGYWGQEALFKNKLPEQLFTRETVTKAKATSGADYISGSLNY